MHDLFLLCLPSGAAGIQLSADIGCIGFYHEHDRKYSYIPVLVFSIRHHVLRHIANAGNELVSTRARHVELSAACLVPRPRAEAVGREPPPIGTILLVRAWTRVCANLLHRVSEAVFHGNLGCGLPGAVHPRIIRPAEGHLGIWRKFANFLPNVELRLLIIECFGLGLIRAGARRYGLQTHVLSSFRAEAPLGLIAVVACFEFFRLVFAWGWNLKTAATPLVSLAETEKSVMDITYLQTGFLLFTGSGVFL